MKEIERELIKLLKEKFKYKFVQKDIYANTGDNILIFETDKGDTFNIIFG